MSNLEKPPLESLPRLDPDGIVYRIMVENEKSAGCKHTYPSELPTDFTGFRTYGRGLGNS